MPVWSSLRLVWQRGLRHDRLSIDSGAVGLKLHSDCAIVAIVSIVSLRIATRAQCECDRSDPIATIARLYLWDPAKSSRARDPSRATDNHRRVLSSFEFACLTAINLVESVRYKAIFAVIMNNHSNVSSMLTKIGLLTWHNVVKEVEQARDHSKNAASKYKTNSMC